MKRTTEIAHTKIRERKRAYTDAAVEAVKRMSSSMSKDIIPEEVIKKQIEQVYAPKTKKVGRPTKYSPIMCKRVIEIMAQGRSRGNAATLMGLTEVTFYDWMKNNPDFSKAVKIGDQLSLLWWMTMGQINIHNKDFNSTLYMMQMQNRFGWSRKLEGKIDINSYNETVEKKIIEIKGEDKFASIARILLESGALESEPEEVIDAQIN
jgi:transposase